MSATTPATILALVYADLQPWAASLKGVVGLTQNPYDLFEILKNSPAGWRLTLHWEGRDPADERVRNSPVTLNHFRFVLDGDLGPTITPKIALFRSTPSRTPFLDLLDAVRLRVMAYKFPWLREPNNHFWWRGEDDQVPLPDGLFLAAYNLRFDLYSEMAMPTEDVELTV